MNHFSNRDKNVEDDDDYIHDWFDYNIKGFFSFPRTKEDLRTKLNYLNIIMMSFVIIQGCLEIYAIFRLIFK